MLLLSGTSHSIAWTTVPVENQQITRHRPFCLDLHEKTFELLQNFLQKYTLKFYDEAAPPPFKTASEYHHFVYLCLKLLCIHLSLCISGGITSKVLGSQAKALRTLLFR